MTVKDKLKPATFKHVEAELYALKDSKREISNLREEILYGSSSSTDENTGGGVNSIRTPGRPTERIVTRLMTNKRLRNLEEIVDAIESVLERLDDTQRKMMRLKYFSHNRQRTWQGIADECNIHEQTAYKYRRMIVLAIAERIGWI